MRNTTRSMLYASLALLSVAPLVAQEATNTAAPKGPARWSAAPSRYLATQDASQEELRAPAQSAPQQPASDQMRQPQTAEAPIYETDENGNQIFDDPGMADAGFCSSCETCAVPCCGLPFGNRIGIFGEFMYLRARNADLNYATPADGPLAVGLPPVQINRQGILDPDFAPSFRVGIQIPLEDELTQLSVVYSHFEQTTSSAIAVDVPNTIRATLVHPSSLAANTDYLDASGVLGTRWHFLDVDYRHIFFCSPRARMNFVAGLRLADFEQRVDTTYNNVGTIDTVNTDIDFGGAGVRFGLEGARQVANRQWFVYGNGALSLIAGEFKADYLQTSTADPIVAQTYYSAGRVVPMLDLEIGAGWVSCNQCIQVRAGYLISSWYNIVRTDQFIAGVRANNMQDLSRAMSFDGLVARIAFVW